MVRCDRPQHGLGAGQGRMPCRERPRLLPGTAATPRPPTQVHTSFLVLGPVPLPGSTAGLPVGGGIGGHLELT